MTRSQVKQARIDGTDVSGVQLPGGGGRVQKVTSAFDTSSLANKAEQGIVKRALSGAVSPSDSSRQIRFPTGVVDPKKVAVMGRKMYDATPGDGKSVTSQAKAMGYAETKGSFGLFGKRSQVAPLETTPAEAFIEPLYHLVMLDEMKSIGEFRVKNGLDTWMTGSECWETTNMMQNFLWVKHLLNEGFTIVDIGEPYDNDNGYSAYYHMETLVVFGKEAADTYVEERYVPLQEPMPIDGHVRTKDEMKVLADEIVKHAESIHQTTNIVRDDLVLPWTVQADCPPQPAVPDANGGRERRLMPGATVTNSTGAISSSTATNFADYPVAIRELAVADAASQIEQLTGHKVALAFEAGEGVTDPIFTSSVPGDSGPTTTTGAHRRGRRAADDADYRLEFSFKDGDQLSAAEASDRAWRINDAMTAGAIRFNFDGETYSYPAMAVDVTAIGQQVKSEDANQGLNSGAVLVIVTVSAVAVMVLVVVLLCLFLPSSFRQKHSQHVPRHDEAPKKTNSTQTQV